METIDGLNQQLSYRARALIVGNTSNTGMTGMIRVDVIHDDIEVSFNLNNVQEKKT